VPLRGKNGLKIASSFASQENRNRFNLNLFGPSRIHIKPMTEETKQPAPPLQETHSRLGIASFVTSVVVGVLLLGFFLLAGVLHNLHPAGPYPAQTLVGLVVIVLLFADMAAIGLGIAAVCQRGTKKVFGILGLSFSTLTIMGTIGLVLLGLKISGKI